MGRLAWTEPVLPHSISSARALGGCLAVWALLGSGCAGYHERLARSELAGFSSERVSQAGQGASSTPVQTEAPPRATAMSSELDGSLRAYVRYALVHNPELEAAFQQWRAATERIVMARRLPEPTLTYMYFVRSVETRVGPQRHRFGISQAIPWPTKLAAAADSASLAARGEQRRLEAAALTVTERVARAYYDLWLIEQRRRTTIEQQRILEQLAAAARARVEVGQASLADFTQVNLGLSRSSDELSGLEQRQRAASARLRLALGAPSNSTLPVTGAPPEAALPAESEAELLQDALAHPRVRAQALMAESRSELARSAAADRYPGFVLGAEYVETGESPMRPVPPDSGKDPIMVSISVKLPLWFGTYSAAVAEARAQSAAFRARMAAAQNEARAELEQILADLRDAVRRVDLYRRTLVPQALTVFSSVLGSYQTGRSSLASVLMAERDLIELENDLFRSQAQFATAWARLEEVVGRSVPAQDPTSGRAVP